MKHYFKGSAFIVTQMGPRGEAFRTTEIGFHMTLTLQETVTHNIMMGLMMYNLLGKTNVHSI